MSAPQQPDGPAGGDEPEAKIDEALPRVDSTVLLQGARSAYILHNGVAYRLSATRAGKLILTK